MDRNQEAGIVAPQLFHEDGTRQPNCRRFPTPGTLALRALRADEIWKTPPVLRYLMEDEPVQAGKVDWVTGAVLVARRAAMEAVGLLDEGYFLYWEDMDWCYRMRRAGWGVFLVPRPVPFTCTGGRVCVAPSAAPAARRAWGRAVFPDIWLDSGAGGLRGPAVRLPGNPA